MSIATNGTLLMPKEYVAGVTWSVSDDEVALTLIEEDIQATNPIVPREVAGTHRGLHRYQIIRVLRGDKWADYWEDLGVAGRYKRGRIGIASLGQDRVGYLRALAAKMRDEPDPMREIEPPPLQEWFRRDAENRATDRLSKGHFGPAFRREAAW